LEDIVHPLVGQAADIFIRRASQKVIVIEAIKLLESNLKTICNAVWVTYAPEDVQAERLMRKRGMKRDQAMERIHAQSPQSEKVASASVVIRNTGSYDDLWKQVTEAWKHISPVTDTAPLVHKEATGDMVVQRGRPRDSHAIAELITRLSNGTRRMNASDVMEAFGDKAYLLLHAGGRLAGLAGCQVENLVARTTDLFLEPGLDPAKAIEVLVGEVERASQDLQSEASLIFPTPELADNNSIWKKLGYDQRTPTTLGVQAWQDAATESMPAGTVLYFKQLRQDRILRPI
jgi:dephospho-CoA kinase